jgi:hypothetical protein
MNPQFSGSFSFKKLSKLNNGPIGENLPCLVPLLKSQSCYQKVAV